MTKHFIATDNDYNRIHGIGRNAEAALADAVEQSDFQTSHPDADPADAFPILPATEALVAMVNDYGGDISWSIKNGMACADEEVLDDHEVIEYPPEGMTVLLGGKKMDLPAPDAPDPTIKPIKVGDTGEFTYNGQRVRFRVTGVGAE